MTPPPPPPSASALPQRGAEAVSCGLSAGMRSNWAPAEPEVAFSSRCHCCSFQRQVPSSSAASLRGAKPSAKTGKPPQKLPGTRLRRHWLSNFSRHFLLWSPFSRLRAAFRTANHSAHGAGEERLAALSGTGLEPVMSGTKLEDSPPCRNWSSASELNETQEPFLNPTDYDDEEFLRYLWREYLHPKEYEWVLIAGYIIVFVVALIGNVLGESGPGQPSRGLSRPLRPGLQRLWRPLPPPGMQTKRSLLSGGVFYLKKKKKKVFWFSEPGPSPGMVIPLSAGRSREARFFCDHLGYRRREGGNDRVSRWILLSGGN